MLDGDRAFAGEVFDFLRAVFFPVADVSVVADAEGAALLGEGLVFDGVFELPSIGLSWNCLQ